MGPKYDVRSGQIEIGNYVTQILHGHCEEAFKLIFVGARFIAPAPIGRHSAQRRGGSAAACGGKWRPYE